MQLQDILSLQHYSPRHAAILAPDVTWRLERASHFTMRQRHFANRGLFLLIAPLPVAASLPLQGPVAAAKDLEQLLVNKSVSQEMGMILEIISKNAV
jgi:hypothetical protein